MNSSYYDWCGLELVKCKKKNNNQNTNLPNNYARIAVNLFLN